MSEWFELDTGGDGSYSYDTASVWEKGYDAYLATVGDSVAGFALIGSGGEWLGDIGAHDVHEFFIVRRFRRRGVGRSVATFLWNEHPGEWLVRVLQANAPAITFWRREISIYSDGLYSEEPHIVDGRPWKFSGSGRIVLRHSYLPASRQPLPDRRVARSGLLLDSHLAAVKALFDRELREITLVGGSPKPPRFTSTGSEPDNDADQRIPPVAPPLAM